MEAILALSVLFQLVHKVHAALGVSVAPVGESVHEYLVHVGFVGDGAQRFHVLDVRVHTAIR
jgi:hypothetical protein